MHIHKLRNTALSVALSLAMSLGHAESSTDTGFYATLKLAQKNDPELKYARQSYLAEQEEDDISFSYLLPKVTLDANYRASLVDDATFNSPKDGSFDREDSNSVSLSLQQRLFDMSAWNSYQRDKKTILQSEYSLKRAEQETIYRVTKAYLDTLLAAQTAYLNQEKLQSLQLKVEQTQRMLELGVGDRLTVLRNTASRDVARSDLLEAKSQLEDARTQLEHITGQAIQIPDSWVQKGHKVHPGSNIETLEHWSKLIETNSELLAEAANIEKSELDVKAKSAQHLPTLDFSLTARDLNSDNQADEETRYTAALNLTIPIYSGGAVSAQVRRSEASLQAAHARYESRLSEKIQTVKLAYSQLKSFKDRLNALEESRLSSKALLDAAEREENFSLASQVDVYEARTNLYDAQLQFNKTLSEYLVSNLNLLLETGQLTDKTMVDYDLLFNQQTK